MSLTEYWLTKLTVNCGQTSRVCKQFNKYSVKQGLFTKMLQKLKTKFKSITAPNMTA